MTTVAYDGKILAADRQAYGNFKSRVKKLWALPDGSLFGGAGPVEQILAVRDWLEDQTKPKPEVADFSGILVDARGKAYRLEEKLIRDRILERFHAVGSGSPFAISAMALGKTAKEAVLFAARFDPRTGGGVDVLTRSLV